MKQMTYLVRRDVDAKPGGDAVLVRRHADLLRDAGWRVSVDADWHRSSAVTADVVNITNVDRVVEAAAMAERSSASQLVVTPVHHPLAAVQAFETRVRRGPVRLLHVVGRDITGRERLKHVIRYRSVKAAAESCRRDPLRAVGDLLRRADLVLAQAPSEVRALESTFAVDLSRTGRVIPNGIEVDPCLSLDGPRDVDVLVVGRVEERKNQLLLARALADTGLRVLFVGGINPSSRAHAEDLLRIIEREDGFTHIDHVALPELRALYVRSRVYASSSYFEVVSLAELEAAAYGCHVVSTSASYSSDFLSDDATYIDPFADAVEWRDAVQQALVRSRAGRNPAAETVRRRHSWEAVGRDLASAFGDRGSG